jgi:hypothetical protein
VPAKVPAPPRKTARNPDFIGFYDGRAVAPRVVSSYNMSYFDPTGFLPAEQYKISCCRVVKRLALKLTSGGFKALAQARDLA